MTTLPTELVLLGWSVLLLVAQIMLQGQLATRERGLDWNAGARDGEAKPELVEQRDRAMGISTGDKRRRRADLQPLARPQSGVDDLKPAFPQAQAIPGVVDRKARTTAAPASGPRR